MPTRPPRPATARRRLLTALFDQLYGPLVLLHEPVGRLAFGPSWAGRRLELLSELRPSERVLDVGAGSGLLVRAGTTRGFAILGVDPSPAMRRLAVRHGAPVIAGRAQSLPFPDASFTALVSSYPGPWIADGCAWSEFERVLAPGSRIAILLGGTIERGAGASVRRLLGRAVYGSGGTDLDHRLSFPTPDGISGSFETTDDEWGRALIWRGRRL